MVAHAARRWSGGRRSRRRSRASSKRFRSPSERATARAEPMDPSDSSMASTTARVMSDMPGCPARITKRGSASISTRDVASTPDHATVRSSGSHVSPVTGVLKGRRAVPLPPHPIPIPLPLLGGSRFVIWKQDPSVGELGRRLVLVPSLVVNGPRDPRIDTNLVGTTPVTRSAAGDFIFPADTPEADCAHTFAVVRETLTMYERLRGGIAIAWAWNIGGNTDPVTA